MPIPEKTQVSSSGSEGFESHAVLSVVPTTYSFRMRATKPCISRPYRVVNPRSHPRSHFDQVNRLNGLAVCVESCPNTWCRSEAPGRVGPPCHCDGWQADGRIIAQGCDGFQAHVAGALHGPLVILFEQQRADEPDDGGLIGEDDDHVAASLDLTVEMFEWVGAVDLGAVLGGEVHIGKDISLGVVRQCGQLGHPRT